MASARVVESFFLTHRNSWVIAIDGLEGPVQVGQQVTIVTPDATHGPFRIKAVEFMLKSARQRISYPALVLSARRNDPLGTLENARIETNDSL